MRTLPAGSRLGKSLGCRPSLEATRAHARCRSRACVASAVVVTRSIDLIPLRVLPVAIAATLALAPVAAQAAGGRTVNVYNWSDYISPRVIEDFTKETGIGVRYATFDSDDILPAALHYLGLDPNATDAADLEKSSALVTKIRPFVRKFHSSEYLNALASGEICFAVGFSGDIKQAQKRAAEAKNRVKITYV